MIKIQLYEQALLALNSNPIRIMFSTHTDFQAMCPKSSSAVQDLSMFLSRLDDFRIVQSLPLIEYDSIFFFFNLSSVSLVEDLNWNSQFFCSIGLLTHTSEMFTVSEKTASYLCFFSFNAAWVLRHKMRYFPRARTNGHLPEGRWVAGWLNSVEVMKSTCISSTEQCVKLLNRYILSPKLLRHCINYTWIRKNFLILHL